MFLNLFAVALRWESHIALYRLIHQKYISLPGAFMSFEAQFRYLDIKYEHTLMNSSLKVFIIWTFDKYKEYKHFFYQKATECLESAKPKSSNICLNISSRNNRKYFTIFNFLALNKLREVSWNEASEMCKGIGGYLPFFTFKKDLDELIAFLKLSQAIPPIQALFIGLQFNAHMVSFLAYCLYSEIYSRYQFQLYYKIVENII